MQLSFAAVDQHDVRKHFPFVIQAAIAASHDLVDTAKVVDSRHVPDLVASIARLERQPVNELDQAGHRLVALQVRDVNPLDGAWRGGQLQDFSQTSEPLLGINEEDLRLRMRFQFPALVERFQHLDLVPQSSGPFELQSRRGALHLVAHLLQQFLLVAVQEHLQAADVLAVVLLADPQVAGSSALVDAGQQAGAEPVPTLV